ncbi:hypothetical protein REO66_003651 [Salmonella enterica]|nr:hypothetical protein [Salmonella enterica]
MWTFLAGISAFLIVLVWICTIVGLVKPGLVKAKNRLHVVAAFFVYNIVLFMICGFAASKVNKINKTAVTTTTEKVKNIPKQKDKPKVESSKEKEKNGERCSVNDSRCLYNEYLPVASYPCKKRIERFSKYDYEWEGGFSGIVFTRISNNAKNNEIIFIGDQLKFTNGFGAKVNMIYSCTYNIKTKSVVDVDVAEGRLPE